MLDLIAVGSACGVTRKPLLAGLQELLRPTVIQALGDALLATQLSNAVFTTQSRQDNPDLLLRRVTLPRLTANVLDRALCSVLVSFRSYEKTSKCSTSADVGQAELYCEGDIDVMAKQGNRDRPNPRYCQNA